MRQLGIVLGVICLSLFGMGSISAQGETAVIPVFEATFDGGTCIAVLDTNEGEATLTVICGHSIANLESVALVKKDGDFLKSAFTVVADLNVDSNPFAAVVSLGTGALTDLLSGKIWIQFLGSGATAVMGQMGVVDSGILFGLAENSKQEDITGKCATALNLAENRFTVGCVDTPVDTANAYVRNGTGNVIFNLLGTSTLHKTVIVTDDRAIEELSGWDAFLSDLKKGDLSVGVVAAGGVDEVQYGPIPPPRNVARFAQFGNGGGWQSDLVLVNTATTSSVAGVIRLRDSVGLPLAIDLADGSAIAENGSLFHVGHSEAVFTIGALGTVTLGTDGADPAAFGSAVVIANGALDGVVRFRAPGGAGVAGVGRSVPMNRALLPARKTADVNTGVAVQNPESHTITVTAKLHGDGISYEASFELAPGAREAKFVEQFFTGEVPVGFSGTLLLSAGTDKLAAVAFEFGKTFTTLPVSAVVGP